MLAYSHYHYTMMYITAESANIAVFYRTYCLP